MHMDGVMALNVLEDAYIIKCHIQNNKIVWYGNSWFP